MPSLGSPVLLDKLSFRAGAAQSQTLHLELPVTREEREIQRIVQLRANVDEAKRKVNIGIYKAVRVRGVSVSALAGRLGLSRARIYQIIDRGEAQLDE